METCRVTFPLNLRAATAAGLACLSALAGCSTVESFLAGEKVDYRSSSTRSSGLDVPPDLTQLSRDSRYQQPSGVVSASTFQTGPATAAATTAAAVTTTTTPTVAPAALGNFKIERLGNDRWLSTSLTPEQVYPQVRAFWKDNGFELAQDRPDAGVIETNWAENRAKLPNDFIRNSIGKVFENAYSTGEIDKYRTRVERTATGSDIYITHRGMEEKYVGERKEATVWQPRAADPSLEAEFLARLMVKLGAKDVEAKAVVAAAAATSAATAPARARLLADRPGPTLQVDDGFDRAWRRVGLALDRSGFTVEDRDRTQGVYFVRYVDPAFAGRDEPGFFTRLFSFGKKDDGSGLAKYRVKVTAEGAASTVAVLDSTGKPEVSETGKRIVGLLLDDLK
jgi:outer membrane protein assembly factor BamC